MTSAVLHSLGQVPSHHVLQTPSTPKGPALWLQTGEVITLITYVGLTILACAVSSAACAVGIAGSIVSAMIIDGIIGLLAKNPALLEGYLGPLSGDLSSAACLGLTLFGGVTVAFRTAQATLIPALLSTLVGYYAPTALMYEVKALISSN